MNQSHGYDKVSRLRSVGLIILSLVCITMLWTSVSTASPSGDIKVTIEESVTGSVSYDGETLVVGDFVSQEAHIYEPTAEVWELRQTIDSPIDEFGWQVDVDGDMLLVSSREGKRTDIYQKTASTWNYLQTIDGGHDAAIGGYTAVTVDTDVKVYRRSGDTWLLEQTFKPDSVSQSLNLPSADIDGDVLAIVDQPANDDLNSGSAYIFEYISGSWQQQIEIQGMTPEGQGPGHVAVDGNTVVIAVSEEVEPNVKYNIAYVYVKEDDEWELQQVLNSSEFGRIPAFSLQSAAIDGNMLLVSTSEGQIYTRANGVWTFQRALTAFDLQEGDGFGVGYGATLANQTAVMLDLPSDNFYSYDLSTIIVDQPPRLTKANTPANGAVDVPIDTDLTLMFDEPVRAGSGNIVIADGVNPISIDVTDTSRVAFDGANVTINPTLDFINATTYSVTMDIGIVEDMVGNEFEGIVQGEWSFTTIDLELPPQLIEVEPAHNFANISVSTDLNLMFDQPVRAGSGSISIIGGVDPISIDVTDTSQVTFDGAAVTINPIQNFQNGATYTVTFGNNVIQDVEGNPFSGIDQGEWTFFTLSIDRIADGVITPADVMYVINRVGGVNTNALTADIDGDKVVTAADVQIVLGHLGQEYD